MDALLVTVLGTEPRFARYQLGQGTERALLAPAALWRLLPEGARPGRILALCTHDAREKTLPKLREALHAQPVDIDSADIPEEPSDHAALLSSLCDKIPEGGPQGIIFDITHGHRHFVFYTLLGIQYLTALREIPLEGAYYAFLRPEPQPSPLIDLRPLLEMFEWIHAVRVFGEAGDAGPLARHIGTAAGQSASRITRELLRISQARAAGLPLELGLLNERFRSQGKEFRRILRSRGALLEDELWRRLDGSLGRFALAAACIGGLKRNVVLNRDELIRQAELIDDLLSHGLIAPALGLMDEWAVSWAVLRDGSAEEWLDYRKRRRPAAARLALLGSLAADRELQAMLSADQRDLGVFWKRLSDLRNAYAHHGMRPRQLIGSSSDAGEVEGDLPAVEAYWQKLKSAPEIPLNLTTTGKLLVSAQGNSRGVLFSAIEACRRENLVPDKCLVLCSDQSAASVGEACQMSGFGGQCELLRFTDPYGGRSELKRIQHEALKHLITADEVLANLTGGTTLMGLGVAAIAQTAKRFARPLRRFGLIDPRPPAEQQANPYWPSEAFWLDEEGGNGD